MPATQTKRKRERSYDRDSYMAGYIAGRDYLMYKLMAVIVFERSRPPLSKPAIPRRAK